MIDGRHTGSLRESFWTVPVEDQRMFFLVGFLILLRSHGLYGLHASGLSAGHGGVLIVGPSGSGKTTLALSLIREGWRYLADDALMLRASDDRVEALALRRGFSLTRDAGQRFPELQTAVATGQALSGGKRLVDWLRLYPERQTSRCRPDLLLFPRITDRRVSEFRPLDETASVIRLMEQSPGIFTDRSGVETQMRVLSRLVAQSSSYEVLLGRDVFESSTDLSRMIAQLGRHQPCLASSSS
jgi:hypothetical protein